MGLNNSFIKKEVPLFYSLSRLDWVLFMYIDIHINLIPSISIQEAAISAMKYLNINEDDFPLKSILQSYSRSREKFYDERKSHKKT